MAELAANEQEVRIGSLPIKIINNGSSDDLHYNASKDIIKNEAQIIHTRMDFFEL